ncbi:MAG: VWA domain-containing protein [Prevotellaceae bacterium]|jgi:Ca-activated chloride channel family protein|nr:VWA domain-containing protein [Prevotellaceae bacterium]
MLQFLRPDYFLLWLIIPALLLVFGFVMSRKHKALKKFGNIGTMRQLMPLASHYRGWFKIIIICVAILFFVLALARPQIGVSMREVKLRGAEVIIALDVSNSMLATDFQPNRLERAKMAISRLVDGLKGDRIGLIVFAGDAYVQLPVTTDYVSAKVFLNSITPNIVSKQGTDMAKAIELAIRSFSIQSEKSRALILITDGENHEGDPIAAATLANEQGISVHTVGIGQTSGAPIKLKSGDMLKDRDGNIVVSKLDEITLQRVAVAGGGTYTLATPADLGLSKLMQKIQEMDKQEMSSVQFKEYEELYMYPLFVALILLMLEAYIFERKNRILNNLDIFRKKERSI